MSLAMLFDEIPVIKEKKVMATRDEKNNFSLQIENIAKTLQVSFIEAITHHCEQSGLEVEIAATLLNDRAKQIIREEAQELRYLPRSSKLPL